MSERLTDDELGVIAVGNANLLEANKSAYVLADALAAARRQLALVTELRERRAQDLTAEERETLRWLRECWANDEQSSGAVEWRRMHPRALAVLDKLMRAFQ